LEKRTFSGKNPAGDSRVNFSVANADFEGGGDGRG
jgi:hypothetical protein